MPAYDERRRRGVNDSSRNCPFGRTEEAPIFAYRVMYIGFDGLLISQTDLVEPFLRHILDYTV
jgi:hypothetical protein